MPLPSPPQMPQHNRVLAALSEGEMAKLRSTFEHVELNNDDVLWETDEKGKYLYFPTSALISLLYENDSGGSVSVATIGRSGVVGASMLGSGVKTPDRAVVSFGGSAFRMRTSLANAELADCTEFQSLMLTCTTCMLTRTSQYAICNRLHRIDQQLGRFLLECRDELQKDVLPFTHDQIAGILGVRRESISLATSQLQKKGLIRNSRGKIKIEDDDRLESAACECYAVIRDHLDNVLKNFRADHNHSS